MSDLIDLALAEDLGSGDLTANYFVDAGTRATARIVARESAVVAGIGTAAEVFRRVDAELEPHIGHPDGDSVETGDVVLVCRGSARSLLTAERTALNFLQRLSGVATLTRRFVDAVRDLPVQILDTRKTTPGFRRLEKAAVVAGGGTNHRMGLYDMAMVKDNHLLAAKSDNALAGAVEQLKHAHPGARVEFEADTLDQVRRFLKIPGVDVILLDNMSLEELRAAVAVGQGTGVRFEASGGVTFESVRAIAETGVDFISIGALTHSAGSVDFSLEFDPA